MRDDSLYKGILSVCSDYRDNIKEANLSALVAIEEAVLSYSELSKTQRDEKMRQEIIKIGSNLADIYRKMDLPNASEAAETMSTLLTSTAVAIEQSVSTDMLNEIKSGLIHSDFRRCLEAMRNAIIQPNMEAPDMAFFRTAKIASYFQEELEMPPVLSAALRMLNVFSAKRIARIGNLGYYVNGKRFFDKKNPEITANVPEMNVLCTGAAVLADIGDDEEIINEMELMEFQKYLYDRMMLGSQHPVGQKILSAIRETRNLIDFDCDKYYHSRKRDKESEPFTWVQMGKAPDGLPEAGRYNGPGKAYYYFADTQAGAEYEVSKHMTQEEMEKIVLQTVRLVPLHNVKMIDLSGKFRRGYTTFLKCIREPLNGDRSRMPRKYLIPMYVSDCCRECEIDGIKYYGGKEYTNYVTWEDTHLGFDGFCIT